MFKLSTTTFLAILFFSLSSNASSLCNLSEGILGTTLEEFEKDRKRSITGKFESPSDLRIEVLGFNKCKHQPQLRKVIFKYRFIDGRLASLIATSSSKSGVSLYNLVRQTYGEPARPLEDISKKRQGGTWWQLSSASMEYRRVPYSNHWIEKITLSASSFNNKMKSKRLIKERNL